MGRGDHPNSRANLKPGKNSTSFTAENAAEMQKKSTAAKIAMKSFIELDAEDPNTTQDRKEMLNNLKKAAKHNLRAFEIYRDTVGLKQKDAVEVQSEGIEIRVHNVE